jgi:transposase
LIKGNTELLLFEKPLERFRAHKLLRERGKQRTDSTHVLAAVHALNRLSCAGQTFRHALNVLATVAPDWFLEHTKPEWIEEYGKPFEVEHTIPESKKAKRTALERAVAADGLFLLEAVFATSALGWLKDVPAVQVLWRVWIQNFTWVLDATLRFRTDEEVAPARDFINSPFDIDARLSRKRATYWVGYKAHLTKACDEDLPMLITNVKTTLATTQDFDAIAGVHKSLQERNLLPKEHLVDMGYVSAQTLVDANKDHDVDLVGPARRDERWQAWKKAPCRAPVRVRGFLLSTSKWIGRLKRSLVRLGKQARSGQRQTIPKGNLCLGFDSRYVIANRAHSDRVAQQQKPAR